MGCEGQSDVGKGAGSRAGSRRGGRGDERRLLTAAEVAERLGYTERYVWKLGRQGVLPRIKLPGRKYVRFAEEGVERLVREARQVPAPVRRRAVVRSPASLPSRF